MEDLDTRIGFATYGIAIIFLMWRTWVLENKIKELEERQNE